ncbi:MAG: hypothetical protein OXP75_17280 [Rhodospirillales bacterium]|nr:hypothetical protein [Rhodospirillales bacterium]
MKNDSAFLSSSARRYSEAMTKQTPCWSRGLYASIRSSIDSPLPVRPSFSWQNAMPRAARRKGRF